MDLDVIKNETSPLLLSKHGNTPQPKIKWRKGSILACSVFAVLCAAAATPYCIRGVAGRNAFQVAKPALVAGRVIAGDRALLVAHSMLLQPTRADFITARKLYTLNLLLLALGLFVALIGILFGSYSSP